MSTTLEEVIGCAFTSKRDSIAASLTDVDEAHIDLAIPEGGVYGGSFYVGRHLNIVVHQVCTPSFDQRALEPINLKRIMELQEAKKAGLDVEIVPPEFQIPSISINHQEFQMYAREFRKKAFWNENLSTAPFRSFLFPEPEQGYKIDNDVNRLSAISPDGKIELIAYYSINSKNCLVHEAQEKMPKLWNAFSDEVRKLLTYLVPISKNLCEEERAENERLKQEKKEHLAKKFGLQ